MAIFLKCRYITQVIITETSGAVVESYLKYRMPQRRRSYSSSLYSLYWRRSTSSPLLSSPPATIVRSGGGSSGHEYWLVQGTLERLLAFLGSSRVLSGSRGGLPLPKVLGLLADVIDLLLGNVSVSVK